MRILTVSHFYEAHGGGIERVSAQHCRQLSRLGHEVVWAASDADSLPKGISSAPLRCFDPLEKLTGLPMPLPGPRAITALAAAVHASDGVVIHDALYVTSILALLMAKAKRKRCVLVQHIAGIAFASRILRGLMACANLLVTRPMLAGADHLVFISDAVRRELIGEPARRSYQLLFNGVDTTVYHPLAAHDPVATRNAFGLPPQGPLVAFVGRFVEKKGLTVLRALAARRPTLQIAMVGNGPIRPESWGLPNIHVLGPRLQPDVAAIYRTAEALLLPSIGEGYPLVMQEAMACGLPVICGEGSGRADPGASRFLRGVGIDLSDPEGSAVRCLRALDSLGIDPVDRVQMSHYAASRYDWSATAASLAGLLKT